MFKKIARKHNMLLSLVAMLLVANVAHADTGAIGTWQTESSEKGYLHVNVEQCDDKLCGTILQAYDMSDTPIADYEHIGEKMIWNMGAKSDTSWAGGKIWDPSEDKTYKSKMSVKGDVLSVAGCVLMFCKAQDWTRVK